MLTAWDNNVVHMAVAPVAPVMASSIQLQIDR